MLRIVLLTAAKEQYWKTFNITCSENIKDFIGGNIEREGKRILLSQPDLIKKMITQLESKIKNTMRYEMHAPTSTHTVQYSKEGEEKEFRCRVGSLFFLFKTRAIKWWERIEKFMDQANKAHKKSLYQVIRILQETRQQDLVFEPKRNEYFGAERMLQLGFWWRYQYKNESERICY